MSADQPQPANDTARTHFLAAWRDTLLSVLRDQGVLLILVAAPVLYGFFYPWPYSSQAVTRVPVALVDQDGSGLARQIARFAAASPHLELQLVTGDERQAQQLLWQGRIEGYALLPADLKRRVLRGDPVVVPVAGNGAYALLNKAVLTGFAEAVGTVSAGIEIRKLQAGGMSGPQAMASRSPLNVEPVALFNRTEGYGSYVVPAVALLILQQTLMMGAAMLVGGWSERRRLSASLSAWLGRVAGLSSIGLASGLFYFGWIFFLQDYPRGGNPPAALLLLLVYVPAVCTLGLLVGLAVGDRERALQVLLFTALPMFFMSGVPWPAEALPELLQAGRWLIPSTLGIQASLRVNQMGAPLADVWIYLGALAAQALIGLLVLTMLARSRGSQPTSASPVPRDSSPQASTSASVPISPNGAPTMHNLPMQLNFIANTPVASASGQSIDVLDPSDGQVFAAIQRSDASDIDAAVQAARACFDGPWSALSAAERGRLLMQLSRKVAEHADELALLEQRDCGKPTKQAQADAVALARYFEFYAGACDKLHGQTLPYQNGYSVFTWREPHGVTGHIVPWNYPMQIFGRSVGGALAAGNCCVVKPSEDACLSLLRVAELAAEAGFPAGAINIVTGYGHEVGDALARHRGIDHISFTGSPGVGTVIQQVAAERHCPVTLELGGKSPQIIFADADLDAALPVVINAIVQNAGQTCSAGSRLLIEQAIYDDMLQRLGAAFAALRVGPAAMDLDVGPLIRQSQQQRVQQFLEAARTDGIRTVAQGQVVAEAPASGFYQAPVLLADVPQAHRIAQQEVFGPVLAAMPFTDEDHAVQLANATDFGLVAGIWTRDGARQMRMARRVRSGQVFINNYGAGGGVELPFGGFKSSGYGREKGFEALYGFTVLKTVAMYHG